MAKPLSMDLRERVLATIAGGVSGRQAAERFGVSAASVSRWRMRELAKGRRTHRQWSLGCYRSHRRHLHPRGIYKLLRRRRIFAT